MTSQESFHEEPVRSEEHSRFYKIGRGLLTALGIAGVIGVGALIVTGNEDYVILPIATTVGSFVGAHNMAESWQDIARYLELTDPAEDNSSGQQGSGTVQ